jgi:hypothetical protein
MPVAAVAAALFGGVAICRACGGPNIRALRAVNLLTQTAFLLAYLAVR